MAYIKQNFKPEQVLTAAELNAMDNQIQLNDLNKQDKLVSGTNIKTINGESILGSGDIIIEGGSGTVEKTTEEEITAMGFTKNQGTVTAVKINGDIKNPSNGVIDLGSISDSNPAFDPTGYATEEWVKDQNYATTAYVDSELEDQLKDYVTDVQIDGTSVTVNGIAIIDSSKFKGDKGDKGEQGPQGDPGTSVTIKGSFATVEELKVAYIAHLAGDSSKFAGGTLTAGDGYLIEGNLWVYDGSEGDFDTSWTNVGAIKGEQGDTLFKSIVFTRSNGNPSTPKGGDFEHPIPDKVDGVQIWSDTIPEGQAILWASTCIFNSSKHKLDSANWEAPIWSNPVRMTDTADFEVIYSSSEAPVNPNDLSVKFYRDENGGINGWLSVNNINDIWNDNGTTDSIWMATTTCKNGVWGNWTISKIKGEASTIYKIIASDTTIRKNNVGEIKNTEDIVISVYKTDGSSAITNLIEEILNPNPDFAYSITKSIDDAAETKISVREDLIITTNTMNDISKKITYNLYYDRTGIDANKLLIDSVTISVVKDGANGVDGKMMYFDGEFVTTKTYVPTEKALPYIYDDSGVKSDSKAPKYFYLRADSYGPSETTPYTDYMDNKDTNQHSWEPIESMDVLYSKIGLFETANVGPAVFYKDWVFSQADTTGNTGNFHTFTFDSETGEPTGDLKPAVWFNFKTGQGSLANGNISWTANGNVSFGPNVTLNWQSVSGAPTIPTESRITEITNTAISTAEINADNIKSGTIDASKITVKNITVDRLDTAPNATGDKVKIDDNTVKVLNATGDENIILSNDVIGNINANTLVNDSISVSDLKQPVSITWNTATPSQCISKYGTTTITSGTEIVKPSLSVPTQHFYIGLVNKGGTIEFFNQVYLLKNPSSGSAFDFSYEDIISPMTMTAPTKTYWTVNDTNLSNSPSLTIDIECYENETWTKVTTLTTTRVGNAWNATKGTIPGTTVTLLQYTCYQSKMTYNPTKRGIYRAQVKFLPGCVNTLNCTDSTTTMNNATRMLFTPYYEVDRNFNNTNFTEIGKNGIVIKGKENVFVIDDNEITMSNASYGLKLNSSGFSRWDSANSKWVKLDLSKLDKTE